MVNNKKLSISLLFITVLVWGFAYPVLDYIMSLNEMSYAMINLLRFGSGAVVLLPFVFTQFKKMNKKDYCLSVVSAIVLFFAFLFLTLSIADGTPGVAALLLNGGVFVVPLLSSIANKKVPGKIVFISLILIFIGFIFLYFKDGFSIPDGKFSMAVVYGLLSSFMFSLHIFIIGRYHKHEEVSLCMTSIQLFMISALFAIYILIFESSHMFAISGTKSLLPIIVLGVVATGLAYFFQTKASVNLSEMTCNIILSLESMIASISSLILGYDSLTIMFAIGIVIIALGVYIYMFDDIKNNKKLVNN